MKWFKVDTDLLDHPRFADLPAADVALYVDMLAYCARHETDGFFPDWAARSAVERRLPLSDEVSNSRVSAQYRWSKERLINRELWGEAAGGCTILRFLQHNKSRSEMEALRDAAKDRRNIRTNVANRKEVEVEKREASAPQRRSQLPEGWGPTPELLAWVRETLPTVNPVTETAKFSDHHRAKGTVMLKWDLAWRNWMRRSLEFSGGQQAPTPSRRSEEQQEASRRRAMELAGMDE